MKQKPGSALSLWYTLNANFGKTLYHAGRANHVY